MLGIFIEVLEKSKASAADLDDLEKMSRFFGLIKHFNKGKPMDNSFKTEMEQFFCYKWKSDRNQAINDEDEKAILDQLPVEVQDKLYFGFLFQ